MDPYKQHRDAMYNFIIRNFSQYGFDRAQNFDNEIGKDFRSYQEFAQHQLNVVNNLDLNSLTFIQQIQSLIEAGNLGILEEESETTTNSDGFYFDSKGKIIFISPR